MIPGTDLERSFSGSFASISRDSWRSGWIVLLRPQLPPHWTRLLLEVAVQDKMSDGHGEAYGRGPRVPMPSAFSGGDLLRPTSVQAMVLSDSA